MTDNELKVSEISKNTALEHLEKWFQLDTSWDSVWRENAREWYNLYHGNQWTGEEISALEERGQAVLTFNHIKPAIDSIIGSERQNRPKISMAGRTIDDQQSAQAKTSLYDYIQYNSSTDDETDKMVKDALIAGRGWMYIYPELEDGKFKDIMHTSVDYRDMFIDPMSKRDDLKDCRRIHNAVFTDEDIVKRMFPKYEPMVDTTHSLFAGSSEEDMWYELGNRNRPRLISTWYIDESGEMTLCIWTQGQILYFKKNPYEGNSYPYVQYVVERDLQNMPYGLVKSMVSAQEEVNKRHSKAMHYLNAKQVLAEEDAFKDAEQAKITLAKPNGITILTDGALSNGKVQIIDNTPLANTHIQMMDFAKQEILSLAGINGAFLGQASQYESAKKTNMSITQSQTTLVPMLNKLRIARHDIAKFTMYLVPIFYTEARMIRLIEPNGKYSFMPVNQAQLLDDDTIMRVNDLTNQDIDIIIEDAPRGLNEREEQFAQLLQIQGQTARPIPMDILLRYSSIKDKHQLANDIQAANATEAQLQQATQMIQQLQQQIQQLGGTINQKDSQIVQISTAMQVGKEVTKAKEEIAKEKAAILGVVQ